MRVPLPAVELPFQRLRLQLQLQHQLPGLVVHEATHVFACCPSGIKRQVGVIAECSVLLLRSLVSLFFFAWHLIYFWICLK